MPYGLIPCPSMPLVKGHVEPFPAWEDFLRMHPDEDGPYHPRGITLTRTEAKHLHDINSVVNSSIRYRVASRWSNGARDIWESFSRDELPAEGDCEEYALTKRRLLHEERGWFYGVITPVVCTVPTAYPPWHAVLAVRTTIGTFILDNRLVIPVRWTALNYVFYAQHIAGKKWQLVDRAAAAQLAARR